MKGKETFKKIARIAIAVQCPHFRHGHGLGFGQVRSVMSVVGHQVFDLQSLGLINDHGVSHCVAHGVSYSNMVGHSKSSL